jgi:hypothetical protein
MTYRFDAVGTERFDTVATRRGQVQAGSGPGRTSFVELSTHQGLDPGIGVEVQHTVNGLQPGTWSVQAQANPGGVAQNTAVVPGFVILNVGS